MSISNSDACFAGCTVGIASMSPGNAAGLNLRITENIAEAGISLDQDHPEMLVIGLPTSDIEKLKTAADLCKDFGADIIVIAETMPRAIMQHEFSYLGLPIFAMTEDVKDLDALAVKVIARMCKPHDRVRPNILFSDGDTIEGDLEKDRVERDMRMRRRQEQGWYPLLTEFERKFVGVLGGAGPLASAAFLVKCAEFGVPFVCYSNTSAPSKNDYEVNGGPSYVDHYKNSCYFFALINPGAFVIACNTAHMRMGEYLRPYQSLYNRFVDIRSGILDESGQRIIGTKCIVLGTSRTSGVGLPDGEPGLYEDYRRMVGSESEIIVGTPEQQAIISSAIVDAKAGRMSANMNGGTEMDDEKESQASNDPESGEMFAREKILHVVNQLRAEHGEDYPVVFGCTELPLPFSMMEMSHYGLFDPAQRLVEVVRKKLLS